VGVFVFPSLAREYGKVKGGYTVGEIDMFGDLWKDGRFRYGLYILLSYH